MRLLLKNSLKKIKISLGRFISIMLIITLGISVFIGLRESTAGMLYTADDYYDNHNLMDFKIISSYGINNDDIDALNKLNNVLKVIPSYSVDTLEKGMAIRIHSLEDDVNNVTLINGNMPINSDECLADYYKYKIGDTINFKDVQNILSISNCKVVGLVKSVLYVRDEKGIAKVGNGKLESFVFINKSNFISEYYTEVYIIAKESQDKNSYYDNYTLQISFLKNELELLKPIRETIRYEEILKEANDEIIKIKKETEEKLNNETLKLNVTKIKLDKAKKELSANKFTTEKTFKNNLDKLTKEKNIIINNLNNNNITIETLDLFINNLQNNIDGLKKELLILDSNSIEYLNLIKRITKLEEDYHNLIKSRDGLNQINENIKSIEKSYLIFEDEILKEELKLENAYIEYNNGVKELEKANREASQKINEAKAKLNDIEKPVWYLLDRTNNSGYTSYKEDVIKVDAIAKVLPAFFIIVVMLMISNTLTRLIEEERTEMGILQANGFSKTSIVFSYLLYVFIAGLLGLGIGLTIGYALIPQIIYGVFLSRYFVPKLITIVSPLPFSLVILTTLIIMTLVTTLACFKELKEVPATLLRPKPPKKGKKILAEKFNLLWSKLSFIWKATVRNLFRYKKRVIMTIIGIAGCTSLLLAAMGLNDSINVISKVQYNDIIKYDGMYILNKDIKEVSKDLLKLFNDNEIVNPLLLNQNAYTFSFKDKIEDVYLVAPSDNLSFNNYVSLKSTIKKKIVSIDDSGVIITEKMAKLLNITVGDVIKIRSSDNKLYLLYVTDVVQNYVSHYIYISKNYYEEIFDKELLYNSIITDGKIDTETSITDYDVLSVTYTSDIIKSFDNFIIGLNKIIIMIIVCASLLAFVVLYNLTIINVSERKREIATFKVLGFYDKEISSYVYRETFILTLIGIAIGLILGIYLHKFIIKTAETYNIMFLTKIKWYSYIISIIITLLFSYVVQLIVNRTLKKIDMIDSLKSIE